MKKLLFIPLFFIAACSGSSSDVKDDSAAETGTDKTAEAITVNSKLDKASAANVTSFENTPESIVMYFYASRIRQDNKWEEVVQPADQRSDRMVNELSEYEKWTFTGYQFKEKQEVDPNKYWVKVWFEINVNGQTDDGTDEATVEMIDGKWVITEVPI